MKIFLKQLEEMISIFKAILPLNTDVQSRLDKKFRLEFNYNSNHIEGNTLTYGETELLLIFDKTDGTHELREYEEMKAHDVAFNLVKEWAKDENFQLAEIHIKQLNEIILVRPYWKEAMTSDGQKTRRLIKVGDYKEFPNSVRLQNGEIFEYASPIDTPIKMGELMEWFKTESQNNNLHPIELAALMHYKFVLIHPFDDGNGRISRLLINYILMKHNLPPVVIKTADKKNYLNALNQADTGNLNAFIKYIAEQLIWSINLSIKAEIGESIEEPDDIDKEISLFKSQMAAKENIGSVKKTLPLITELYLNKLKLVFDLLIDKHKKLDELFSENNYTRMINNSYPTNFDHNNDYIEEQMSTPSLLPNKYRDGIISFGLSIVHKGFIKDKLNVFDVDFQVYIKFDDYQYHIGALHKPKASFLYSDSPSADVLRSIANELMKVHFEEIKKKIG